jgi:hypothetical protein
MSSASHTDLPWESIEAGSGFEFLVSPCIEKCLMPAHGGKDY